MKFSLPIINKPSGYIIYQGPSKIDKNEIVVIATINSDNEKTGNVIQTWILRTDNNPITTVKIGNDKSICGNCIHRGTKNGKRRSCYVNLFTAPNQVYRNFILGKYPKTNDFSFANNRVVRLGSYGDPAAVPYEIWESLIKKSIGNLGYTHQWKKCSKKFSNICMASVESYSDYRKAKSKGYRTFRIRNKNDSLYKKEISCPASKESNNRLTCDKCLACSGTRFGKLTSKNAGVSIIVHGNVGLINSYNKNIKQL